MTTSICEEAETTSKVVAEREQLDKVTCQADKLFGNDYSNCVNNDNEDGNPCQQVEVSRLEPQLSGDTTGTSDA